jgi:para-aminobenzoate synthetase component 1
MKSATEIKREMNKLGGQQKPFVFIIDFNGESGNIYDSNDDSELWWTTPKKSNLRQKPDKKKLTRWEIQPVSNETYEKGFELVQQHIHNGDTYLLNFTQPTPIKCNLSLQEIFAISNAPYKILHKNKFVCFSPESFVKIENNTISSFPMKGTIQADSENSAAKILKDSKETAEHNTIVDLIRNDLSLVANNVQVEKFRYLEKIKTNKKSLWQVSSKISGTLPDNYQKNIGNILFQLLPAGSISGAPKKKTVEIIRNAENYERGFYTGIFGVFDGKNLDSCVLIRFIENKNRKLVYKSGGGITFMSNPRQEYDEMLKKVYVPIY